MFALAGKNLKELWRDKKLFFFSVLSPVLLLFLSHVIFHRLHSQIKKIPIAVVNPEKEIPEVGKLFEISIEKLTASPGKPPLFAVQDLSRQQALREFHAGKVGALLVIPENFTKTLTEEKPGKLLLLTDENDWRTPVVLSSLQALVERFGFLIQKSKGESPLQLAVLPQGGSSFDSGQNSFADICLFAFLFLIPYAASLWVGELERGSLLRFRLANLSLWQLFGGTGISLGFLGFLQVLLLLIVGLIFHDPVFSLLLWIWPIAALILLASYGTGLILATFLDKEKQLNFVATFFLVPLYLFSGSLAKGFPFERISAFFPWRQAHELLAQVMTTGTPGFPLMIKMFISSFILAMLGTHLFSWRRLSLS